MGSQQARVGYASISWEESGRRAQVEVAQLQVETLSQEKEIANARVEALFREKEVVGAQVDIVGAQVDIVGCQVDIARCLPVPTNVQLAEQTTPTYLAD